ncbi:L,D-transpeptidase [Labrys neptuniae]
MRKRVENNGAVLGGRARSERGQYSRSLRHFAVWSMACFVAFAIAGCASTPQLSGEALAQKQAAYAKEPFEVRIVDRSKFGARFQPAVVVPSFSEPPGTIVIDTRERLLYLFQAGGTARRYGVAVGASGYAWSGEAVVGRKAAWPAWYPTDDMHSQAPGLPPRIEPGPQNPLGARAIYLFQNGKDTLYRIHGTSEPWTIGTEASSGCIRMLNEDVIDLFGRVTLGAHVIVR